MVNAGAHLFVRGKPYFDGAMLDLRMLQQVFYHTDNGGNARLIVRPKQGGPIGGDQILALIHQHFGKVFGTEHNAQLFV